MPIRFIHTADWQLGMRRHFLGDGAQARFDEARYEAVAAIGRLASEERCDFVVVAGDVFESNLVDRKVVARAFDELRRYPCPVFLLPGNHDPFDPASVYTSPSFAEKPGNVIVLGDRGPISVSPGVELVGAPWTSKRPLNDLARGAYEKLQPGAGVRVLVAHGCMDALAPDRDNPAAISLNGIETALTEGRVHYVALGDRHSATAVGTSGRVWYAGTPEPTDYDEDSAGRVLIVDLDTDTCAVSERAVGAWRFERRSVDLTTSEDVEALDRMLRDIEDKSRVVLKLALVGQLTLSAKARLDEVLEQARGAFAAIEEWDIRSDLAVLPNEADLASLDVAGFARDALDDLVGAAAAGNEAARDALSLFHRLARGAA